MLPHSGGQKTESSGPAFSFYFVSLSRTREQSTGLATAGATRPLEGVEVRDEMRRDDK